MTMRQLHACAGVRSATARAAVTVVIVIMVSALPSCTAQADEFVSAHNSARDQVGVQGLVWDDTVAAYAQSYAIKQRDQANCALVHSGGPYGENLFWTSASSVSPTDAVNAWVSEKQYYDYASNTCAAGEVCGHYTQVVWANSLRLGCASVACNNNGGTFVICSYDPPGNYVGQRPY